ncbi:hypothetical protein BpHYR1_043426 [Brachionus plicatilis]|uniref:Transmembrane protein n=1 Tax=Brachionus plicatilis TaxID=10195 RepID=A0A3M7QB43_BRAPC|nr:hypothetical protein BpHYR1_043426 [Brachionus plicatilis]
MLHKNDLQIMYISYCLFESLYDSFMSRSEQFYVSKQKIITAKKNIKFNYHYQIKLNQIVQKLVQKIQDWLLNFVNVIIFLAIIFGLIQIITSIMDFMIIKNLLSSLTDFYQFKLIMLILSTCYA